MTTAANDTEGLKERLIVLEKENHSLRKQLKAFQANDHDASGTETVHERAPKVHSFSFFADEIADHLSYGDNDYVKKLINDGTITMNDVNEEGTTLLILAANAGNYEMTQLCLNLGSDLNHKNDLAESAISVAQRYPHIELLLMLHSLNANVGDRIKDKSADLNKEEGIINNILSELELIGDQSKELFQNILLEIMINIISKKMVFDDVLLNLCWKMQREKGNPFESELWKVIKTTCYEIIQSRNKRDWFWMKRCLVPSNIWYKEEAEEKEETKGNKKYLYYKLLGFVADESQNQLNKLQKKLEQEAEANENGWNQLIEFDVESDKLTELKARQEVKKNDLDRVRGKCKVDGCDCCLYIGPATQGDESRGSENYCQTSGCNHLPFKHKKQWLKKDNGSQMDPNKRLIRQDLIPNGIIAEYTENDLNHNATNAKFEGTKFYDLNQYLSKLSLLAQIVDEPFQKSVQKIFNIDDETNIGQLIKKVNGDEKDNNENDGEIEAFVVYKRGPVKLVTRARSKAETDYFNEPYPKSAAVIDLNRCSLIFKDIGSLLLGLDVFIESVSNNESATILSIVRCKNGFKEYIKSVQYADIKLNVLIGGKSNNIIGEVQFLLETMVSYKNAAHSLYAIEREEEFVSNTASKILPLLTHHKKQQKMHTMLDNASSLSELIVFSNLNITDILQNDPEFIDRLSSGDGRERVFKLLVSMMTEQEKTTHLLKEDGSEQTPLDNCVQHRDIALVSALLKVDIVIKAYKDNDEKLAKILDLLFTSNPAMAMIDLVTSKLYLDNAKVAQLMQKNKSSFRDMAQYGSKYTIGVFKRLASMIGAKIFAECLVPSAVEAAITKNGFGSGYGDNAQESDVIKYFLSLKDVVRKYQENDYFIHLIFCALFVECIDTQIIDYVLKALNLSNDRVLEVLKSKYDQHSEKRKVWDYDEDDWSLWNIVGQIVSKSNTDFKNLERLKLFVSYFGKNALIETVFISDYNNVNPFEYAMAAIPGRYNFDPKVLEYMMEFEEIKNGIVKNKVILWRIMYWISRKSSVTVSGHMILNGLDLKEEELTELIEFECSDDREEDNEQYDRKQYYFGKQITQNDIDKLLQWQQTK